MIDVHCHLNFHAFAKDYDQVIKSACQKGITKIINTGTKIDSSQKAVELANKYDNLYAIVGIHPHHADKQELESDWENELKKLCQNPKVIGIGECGLDYYSYKSNGTTDKKLQQELFEKQIMLAYEQNLPLQIHNRLAGEETIAILKHHKKYLQNIPGMFHCFAATTQVLEQALELGFYIGFDGNITYKGLAPGETTSLPELARLTPIDRILTETDSPFLTPMPFRGSRNEPKYVILVGEFIAQLKGVSKEDLDLITEQNAKNVFKLL